jgi:AraC-like DNA-binding protein
MYFKQLCSFNVETIMARIDIHNLGGWLKMAQEAGYQARALSSQLNISQRQLHRYTREVFGQSPQNWLDQQRLTRAGEMVKSVRCIKVVAAELGFKCVSHFSRKFKFFYGLPPAAFLEWSDREKAIVRNQCLGMDHRDSGDSLS